MNKTSTILFLLFIFGIAAYYSIVIIPNIKKLLCKKIAKLCKEYDVILKCMFVLPKETFIYDRLDLETKWIAFKIEVLKALILRKENKNE